MHFDLFSEVPRPGVTPKSGLVFGCAIDGAKFARAEAEMQKKFPQGGTLPGATI